MQITWWTIVSILPISYRRMMQLDRSPTRRIWQSRSGICLFLGLAGRKYLHAAHQYGSRTYLHSSPQTAAGPLANETNLAIKAAVGLKAFGEMSGDRSYSRGQSGYSRTKCVWYLSVPRPCWKKIFACCSPIREYSYRRMMQLDRSPTRRIWQSRLQLASRRLGR
jgi:hypothetical protein